MEIKTSLNDYIMADSWLICGRKKAQESFEG